MVAAGHCSGRAEKPGLCSSPGACSWCPARQSPAISLLPRPWSLPGAGPLGAPAAIPVARSGRLTGCVELLRQPWHWRQAQVLAEGRRGRLDSLDTPSLTVEGRGRGAGTTQFACWEGQLQNPLFH